MDIVTLSLWGISLPLAGFSYYKRRSRTTEAARKARSMMGAMAADIVAIIFLIGLGLSFITPAVIADVLNGADLFTGTLIAAAVGSITLIPAFVAFPLVGTLIDGGAGLVPSVAFLTTLTMVGIKTLPLEAKEFGLKFALIRSGLSFLAAIFIAFLMGGLLR